MTGRPAHAGWPALEPELRRLWAEGVPTAEIGRRIGKTKNAVIGHAHRLELTPRPSPLKPARTDSDGFVLPRKQVHAAKAMLRAAKLTSAAEPIPELTPAPDTVGKPAAAVVVEATPEPEPVIKPEPEPEPELVAEPVIEPDPSPLSVFALPSLPERRADNPRGPVSSFGPPRPAVVSKPMLGELPEGHRCRWPMWPHNERAGRPQRFCTARRLPDACYCAQHEAVAYRRPWSERGEDDADQEDAA